MAHAPASSEDAALWAILEAVAATLDRERPRWRLRTTRAARDGLPLDDGQALQAVAREVFAGPVAPPGVFGLHPELLAAASDAEIRAEARQCARRRRAAERAESRLLRLRDHARRMLAIKRALGAPFVAGLRAAHETGRVESFLGDLPPGAPPFEDEEARRQLARAFLPRQFAAEPGVRRWIERVLGIAADAGGLLLRARASVAEFAGGPDSICGDEPRCGACDLARRALCRHARAAGGPSGESTAAVAGPPAARDGPRGRGLVRRGACRVAALDARWLALGSRVPPRSAAERAEWFENEIEPASSRLGAELRRLLFRFERGLKRMEEDAGAGRPEERLRFCEQAWRLMARLRVIEGERRALRARLLWRPATGSPDQGGASAAGERAL